MRILAVCSQASPARGSEFGVGWGWLCTIAQDHEVWVICNDVAREEVETYRREHDELRNIHFSFVGWSTTFVGTAFWPFVRPFVHRAWRKRVLTLARVIVTGNDIDMCHYVNAVGFLDVVPLWKLGRPFVWGPIGGLSFVDRSLLKYVSWRARFFYRTKNALRSLAIRLSTRPRIAARNAAELIAATTQTQQAMREHWNVESTVIAEIGIAGHEEPRDIVLRDSGEPLKIVWSGRMHSGKAPLLLMEACLRLGADINWQLLMLGDGPDRPELERLATMHGLADRCQFPGWVEREAATAIMRSGHVFVVTSIYDLTSTVLVEALDNGLPVVCLSAQTAAEVIGDDAGLVVDVDSPAGIAAGIADALASIDSDEQRRQGMARAALQKSEGFTWSAKRELLQGIYGRVARADRTT